MCACVWVCGCGTTSLLYVWEVCVHVCGCVGVVQRTAMINFKTCHIQYWNQDQQRTPASQSSQSIATCTCTRRDLNTYSQIQPSLFIVSRMWRRGKRNSPFSKKRQLLPLQPITISKFTICNDESSPLQFWIQLGTLQKKGTNIIASAQGRSG